MEPLLWILLSVFGYFGIGVAAGRVIAPAVWQRSLASWKYEDLARNDVVLALWAVFLAWPLVLPVFAVSAVLTASADRTNPKAAERRAREAEEQQRRLQRRIRELERDMGLPQSTWTDTK